MKESQLPLCMYTYPGRPYKRPSIPLENWIFSVRAASATASKDPHFRTNQYSVHESLSCNPGASSYSSLSCVGPLRPQALIISSSSSLSEPQRRRQHLTCKRPPCSYDCNTKAHPPFTPLSLIPISAPAHFHACLPSWPKWIRIRLPQPLGRIT